MIAVRPQDDQKESPGRRLRVQQDEPGDLVRIVDEVTLPERVHRVDARRTTTEAEITLTAPEATWIHAVLGELLRAREDHDLAGVPAVHLIAMHRDLTELLAQEENLVVHGALMIRRAEVERVIAVTNALATPAQDLERVPLVSLTVSRYDALLIYSALGIYTSDRNDAPHEAIEALRGEVRSALQETT